MLLGSPLSFNEVEDEEDESYGTEASEDVVDDALRQPLILQVWVKKIDQDGADPVDLGCDRDGCGMANLTKIRPIERARSKLECYDEEQDEDEIQIGIVRLCCISSANHQDRDTELGDQNHGPLANVVQKDKVW